MAHFEDIRDILIDLLDVDPEMIRPESYLVRDLEAESIDFLELAVALNAHFKVPVEDNAIFLLKLREHLLEAGEKESDKLAALEKHYAFLPQERRLEMLGDLDGGPVLQVRDLECYIQWQKTGGKAA